MAAKMTAEAAILARIFLFTSFVQLGVLVFPYIPTQLAAKIAPMPFFESAFFIWEKKYIFIVTCC
jgi:hypothetical protein